MRRELQKLLEKAPPERRFCWLVTIPFAAVNAGYWVWFFLQPDLQRNPKSIDDAAGQSIIAFGLMGPGGLLYLLVAALYTLTVVMPGLASRMPAALADPIMVCSGLVGWGAAGFLFARIMTPFVYLLRFDISSPSSLRKGYRVLGGIFCAVGTLIFLLGHDERFFAQPTFFAGLALLAAALLSPLTFP